MSRRLTRLEMLRRVQAAQEKREAIRRAQLANSRWIVTVIVNKDTQAKPLADCVDFNGCVLLQSGVEDFGRRRVFVFKGPAAPIPEVPECTVKPAPIKATEDTTP